MTILFKGLRVAKSVMIKNQYVDILQYKQNLYIDSISISRILEVLYIDLIKYLEEDTSLYSFETTVSGFNQNVYALNVNQISNILKKLDKSMSSSVAIIEALKNIK